ncbi:EpsG family protein [uncultured Psychrobacter sp.]|uniref:EpsG family protein n=1 Tax=uncultured Psychrobacter sp. TaxID=259303 RepID=UPI00259806D6|nr:EpsG family protein [uncultured Psychrobacter sp.]
MISNSLFHLFYSTIYLCIAFCTFFLIVYQNYYKVSYKSKKIISVSKYIVSFFTFILILLVGFRAFDVGTDTGNYYRVWLFDNSILEGRTDFIFYYIMELIRSIFDSYQVFLLVISSIFYIVNYRSLKKISINFDSNFLFVFFVFLSLFFSLSTSINIIRQGVSLSFFLLGLSYLPQKKYLSIIICFLVSLGFHLTAIIPILFIISITLFSRIGVTPYVLLFFFGVLLSFFNFGLLNISPVLGDILTGVGDVRASYLETQELGYRVGFRPDFVIFNTIFLLLFLNIRKTINDYFYDLLVKFYCLSSFLFFMAFQLNFSDRFGLFGWFVIAPLLAPALSSYSNTIRTILLFFILLSLFAYFNIIL